MSKRFLALLLVVVLGFTLAACASKGLDKDAEGEITIMTYNGDGQTYEDFGHAEIDPLEITNKNVGLLYAVAKEFNVHYPNIKINVHFKQGDSYNNTTKETWDQYRSNFEQQTGDKVDIWSVTDLAADTTRGLVSDLSVFAEYDSYKEFNPQLLGLLNYYGVQAALPEYLIPWGIYVNRDLAEEKNIDVPDPDWTIEEYTEFITNSVPNEYYGSENPHWRIMITGATTMGQQLLKQGVGGDYINVNSDEVRAIVPYFAQWAEHALWPTGASWSTGATTDEFYSSGSWWQHNFFKQGKMLTNADDPWMLGDAANPFTSDLMKNDVDWDYYPRPSTSGVDNTVGFVLDPIAVRNYAMDDNNAELSEEEFKNLEIAYTFAHFWTADTRSWEARSRQQYNNGTSLQPVLNDGLPVIIGDEYDKQMEYWYSVPTHAYWKNKEKTPGFQMILDIFKDGILTDTSDKAYPWTFDNNGSRDVIIKEIWGYDDPKVLSGDPEATSPRILDGVAATNAYLARLPEWNIVWNERFEQAFADLKEALKTYYQKSDADFE